MDGQQITPDDIALLETFRQTYTPAYDMQESTEHLSTADVYEQLAQNKGDLSFDISYLDNWLTENGYSTTMVEMKRFWMFKKD